ncbi:hypothetical protein [Burkholderia mayonis]|uniref:hypothetical protein n=1 Tax=Burkholderia mayonis TaxID=1385591 RepID=UPI00131EEEE7|nr:hypothetical protein [Burkholderia mayonis]
MLPPSVSDPFDFSVASATSRASEQPPGSAANILATLHATPAARMIVNSRRASAHRTAAIPRRGPQPLRIAPLVDEPCRCVRRPRRLPRHRLPRRRRGAPVYRAARCLKNPRAALTSSISPITALHAKDEPSNYPRGRKFDEFV